MTAPCRHCGQLPHVGNYSIDGVRAVLGVARSTVWRMLQDGRLARAEDATSEHRVAICPESVQRQIEARSAGSTT